MFVFDEPRVSGRRAVAGVMVSVLVILGGIAAWWLRPANQPAQPTKPTGRTVAFRCDVGTLGNLGDGAAAAPAQAEALEICNRQAADAARRGPRPSQDPEDPETRRIWNAVRGAVCPLDNGWPCGSPRPATEADVTTVRGVLTGSGYPDAVVRLERAGDPAPDGSVVYAVRLSGDRCMVAFAAIGSLPNRNGLSGVLPNGECLVS